MIMFTAANHLSMSWPWWIQFTSFHLIYLFMIPFKTTFPSTPTSFKRSVSFRFSGQIPLRISFLFSHYFTFLTSQLFTVSKQTSPGQAGTKWESSYLGKNTISFPLIKVVHLTRTPSPTLHVFPIRLLQPSLSRCFSPKLPSEKCRSQHDLLLLLSIGPRWLMPRL